jgi:hypothetical protein
MTELSPRRRAIGLILWCSFLAAAIATMICFAYVDPESALTGEGVPGWWTRRTVYAAGFFFFWAAAAGASALTLYMVQTSAPQAGR